MLSVAARRCCGTAVSTGGSCRSAVSTCTTISRCRGGAFPLRSRSMMLSTTTGASRRPIRKTVSPKERAELRSARKERATRTLQQQQQGGETVEGGATSAAAAASGSTTLSTTKSLAMSRWIWYLGLGVPTVLLVWGFQDEKSPPAKFCKLIGLTGLVSGWTDQLAKPSFDKLLPDWSQVNCCLYPEACRFLPSFSS